MGCGWAADGLRMGRWTIFLFIPGAPLGEDHRPLAGGRPTTHPSSASNKKYPKSQISHLVHPLNSFRFASNFHILLGRAVEVKSLAKKPFIH
jgi:hypothetical protein